MPLMEINTDHLNSTSRDEAARLALQALHSIQNDRPHLQVFAVALLFCALCKRLGLSPYDMHSKALRMLEPSPYHKMANVQVETLSDFAGYRLADNPIRPTSMPDLLPPSTKQGS